MTSKYGYERAKHGYEKIEAILITNHRKEKYCQNPSWELSDHFIKSYIGDLEVMIDAIVIVKFQKTPRLYAKKVAKTSSSLIKGIVNIRGHS